MVVGQGYVGLPLAMRAVEVGHDVVGYDVDSERVKALAAAESYVEDVPSTALAAALDSGRFRAADCAKDFAGFSVAVITVPTPLHEGNPDLSFIEASARSLARYICPGATVILESTTYPGTTEELVGPILEEGSGLLAGLDFQLGYSPERIDPGNPSWSFRNTPKVVSGIDAASLRSVQGFYDSVVETTVATSSCKEAELTKLLENTFRHGNIALVNELAMYAHDLGIDIWAAIDAASTKPFGYMRFTPGPGVGGHCLTIDPSYLSWRVKRTLGRSFRFVELANDINDHMPDYLLRRLTAALNRQQRALNRSRILLLRLAYKRNTGDARESPALRVVELLLEMGAEVHAADPHVVSGHVPAQVRRVDCTAEEVGSADALVLLADHDSFDLDMVASAGGYILDARHRLTGDSVEYL